MTQFNEGRGAKELKQLKSLALKIQEAKKENKMSDKSYITTRGINPQKLPLLLTLLMNQLFSVTFQLKKILL